MWEAIYFDVVSFVNTSSSRP